MDLETRNDLINYLKGFTTDARWETINKVLANRTNHITLVLEDLHKPHNANAVLRSCDGFGIQDVHIIENNTEFDSDKQVSMGSHNWLTLNRYNESHKDNIKLCFDRLKQEGYQVLATTPHEQDQNLNEISVNRKTALVFGTERKGISERVKELADGFVKIPMYGFSESFNISVSAAICLYDLRTRLEKSNVEWGLDIEYQNMLKLKWLKQTIKASDNLIEKFLAEKEES
ncbi:MAG: RNA methyltransferase [Balneolaceae bacterium]